MILLLSLVIIIHMDVSSCMLTHSVVNQLQAREQPSFMILLLSLCDYHSHGCIQLQAHTQRRVQLQARKQPTFMILLFLSHCDYHSHKRIQLQAHTQRSSPAAGTRAANLHDIIIIMSM